jgi:hypothetical protein
MPRIRAASDAGNRVPLPRQMLRWMPVIRLVDVSPQTSVFADSFGTSLQGSYTVLSGT